MASLSNAKVLGGVGSSLALFPVIGVIGWILILVAAKEISDATQDKSLLEDAVIGGVTAIISAVTIVFFLVSGAFIGFLDSAIGNPSSFGPGGLAGAVATFVVFDVFAIISGIFLKRAYDKTGGHLKVGAFATTGLLYLIGALTAVIVVGFLIFFIAFIFQIVAYFSIQDHPPPTYYSYQPPQPIPIQPPQVAQPQRTPAQPSVSEFKFCFKCGAKLPYSAAYCSSCGTRQ
jgi:uncharacterized membrane protein/ribosomal protein L40E